MGKKKAAPPDRQKNAQSNDTTDFLDVPVSTDGKRSKEKLTPEALARIVEALPPLSSARAEILQRYSAILPEVIASRGYRQIEDKYLPVLKQLGFSEKHGPGLLIPLYGQDGEIVSCQVRFDDPVTVTDPKSGKRKKLRYLSPDGLDQRIDFPIQQSLEPDAEIWITEGCKKADALRSYGLYALCLTGVWNWSGKAARKDLQSLDWKGRTAVICYDSDVRENESVSKSRHALTGFLKELGAEVKWVTPPSAPDGTKVGVDDFLGAGGSLEDLPFDNPDPDWIGQLVRSETTGVIKVNSANLTLILQHDDRFHDSGTVRYDEFSNVLLLGERPVTDALVTEIGAEIELTWKLSAIPPGMLLSVLMMLGRRNGFHPVRDYLKSLRWDGNPLVDGLFSKYFGAKDTEYARAVSRTFMIGAVARIMKPGCKVDLVPIIRGKQGAGKSTGLMALFGESWTGSPTSEWGSKDFLQHLHSGVWCLELAELSVMRRSEVEHIKRVITAQSDRFRLPYGRAQEDFPRQTVFAGTTNADEFLKDPTGNRRFLPIGVGAVDVEGLTRDRDHLWAEAFVRYQGGESWHEIPWEYAEEEREAVFEADAWEERIGPWISSKFPQETTISEILEDCLELTPDRQGRSEQTRIGNILRRWNWRPRQVRSGEARIRVYSPAQHHVVTEDVKGCDKPVNIRLEQPSQHILHPKHTYEENKANTIRVTHTQYDPLHIEVGKTDGTDVTVVTNQSQRAFPASQHNGTSPKVEADDIPVEDI